MEEITINDANLSSGRLDRFLDHVHDRWFDLDSLRSEDGIGLVDVPISDRRRGPIVGHILVEGVKKFEIDDRAEIGRYDINTISIDPTGPTLVLECNAPLTITLHLDTRWTLRLVHGE